MNLLGKIIVACSLLLTQVSQASIIYQNDFEASAGAPWSTSLLDITPVGNRSFLGQFGNETVSLSLDNLEAHNTMTISFDLFVIQSWDGNQVSGGGFDVFTFGLANGLSLLSTTFSNTPEFNHNQSYSASNANGDFVAHTDAAEINSLGYSFYGDSVYNLSFTFAHAANDVQFNFNASGLQSMADESWGIDNVMVEVSSTNNIPEPSTLFLFALPLLALARKFN
ncbi:hypothetical protein KO495_08720 [Colwellia sp. D2M02]|uniref:hypothetical protein n=1 Tax=Colwellia sp. D2M02 TaxID=2841562 RepID=UPI001C096E4C|nr:hypothetical protein [Colwellia sp. D2M02]MBU2893411.1 hypothetical protein [Colwellia sp. D2M02]